jgi:hypothetical protein
MTRAVQDFDAMPYREKMTPARAIKHNQRREGVHWAGKQRKQKGVDRSSKLRYYDDIVTD